MQYIKKENTPPVEWDDWFTTAIGTRTYDYKADYSELLKIRSAKKYLIDEQHGFCAYCN